MNCNGGVFLCLLTHASLQPQLVLSQVPYRFRKGCQSYLDPGTDYGAVGTPDEVCTAPYTMEPTCVKLISARKSRPALGAHPLLKGIPGTAY